MNSLNRMILAATAALALAGFSPERAAAQDKVAVGVFPLSSSLDRKSVV